MTIHVLSPVAGTVIDLSEVPDPVFSGAVVGPGIAIDPAIAEEANVVAPVAGTVVKLHPHAFVVKTADETAVLVHLGLDTVQLEGKGFTLHVAEGAVVEAGQVLVTWSPKSVQSGGRSPITPVVALDAAASAVYRLAQPGDELAAGEPLFDWI